LESTASSSTTPHVVPKSPFHTKGSIPSDLPDEYLHNPLTTQHVAELFLEHANLPVVGKIGVVGEDGREIDKSDSKAQQQRSEHQHVYSNAAISSPNGGITVSSPLAKGNNHTYSNGKASTASGAKNYARGEALGSSLSIGLPQKQHRYVHQLAPPACSTSWTLESSKLLSQLKHYIQIQDFSEKNAFPDWGVRWDDLMGEEEIRRVLGFSGSQSPRSVRCSSTLASRPIARQRIFRNEYFKWREPCKRTHASIAVVEDFALRQFYFKDFLERYEKYMDIIEKSDATFEDQHSQGTPYDPSTRQWNYSFPMPPEKNRVYREYMIFLFGGIDEHGKSLSDCWIFDMLTGFWLELHFDALSRVDPFEQIFSSKREYHQHFYEASEKVKHDLYPEAASLMNQSNRGKNSASYLSKGIRELSFFKKTADDLNTTKLNKFHNLHLSDKNLTPQARAGHMMVNTTESQILLFGGKRTEEYEFFNDIWMLNFSLDASAKWRMVSPRGKAPSPRWNFSMCLFQSSRLFIYGGEGPNNEIFGDMACYDLEKNYWLPLKKTFPSPNPRMLHSACIINSLLFVIGGVGNPLSTSDVWSWDMESTVWKSYSFSAPSPFHDKEGRLTKQLYGHQCVSWEKKIIVFGGKYSHNVLHDKIWIFDTTTYRWNDITLLWNAQNPPLHRHFQAMAVYNHNYVDSDLLETNDEKAHEAFRFLIERKKVHLPNKALLDEDVKIRRLKDVFLFGGESGSTLFDELSRLTLRIEMEI